MEEEERSSTIRQEENVLSDYYVECDCCGKEVHIRGGYIGTFDSVYCIECGFWGDYCGLKCQEHEFEDEDPNKQYEKWED